MMKIAGVSLIAAASPTPTPANFDPLGTSRSTSPTTSAASSRLIWPKVTVSRIGSSVVINGSARASTYQRGQPCRSATGKTSQIVVTTSAARLASSIVVVTAPSGTHAIGDISRAANGGDVK